MFSGDNKSSDLKLNTSTNLIKKYQECKQFLSDLQVELGKGFPCCS